MRRGPRFWLQMGVVFLAVLNAVALFLYIDPPGGSREELTQERQQVRNEIAAARMQAHKLETVVAKVQFGTVEGAGFQRKYFLPRRRAYEEVIAEIQRMASASGLHERDGVYTQEPIEGTSEFSLLNTTSNYEGSYASLMKFLYEVDRSPMLLMLDTLSAAPQQHGGQIVTTVRFQAIIHEDSGQKAEQETAGGQQ